MGSINDLLPPPRTADAPRVPRARVERRAPATLASRRRAADLARPGAQERADELLRTQAALDALIAERTAPSSAPVRVPASVEYAAAGSGGDGGSSDGGGRRTLRIVDEQHDPLEPPRHRFRKEHRVVPATAETAAPVLRAAPRLGAAERQEWLVPASVSNWKNPRGFAIELERRAAADKAPAAAGARHGALAEALAVADDDVRAEQAAARAAEEAAAEELAAQQRLKLRLLAQKQRAGRKRRASNAHANDAHASNAHANDVRDRTARGAPGAPPRAAAADADANAGADTDPAAVVDADIDLFDARLFHKSRRRHGAYDGPLFAHGAPADNAGELRPVEFEKE